MADGINYAGELQSTYTDYINNSYDRLNRALDEISTRDYTVNRYLSDVLDSWMGLANVLRKPYELVSDRKRLVAFTLTPTDTQAVQAINIPNHGVIAVASSSLIEVTSSATIPASKVTATIVANGDMLVVRLDNLTTPLTTGTYLGNVHRTDTGDEVAKIRVDVAA